MMTINVNNKTYKIEFSFDAAEEKNIVSRMFNYVSGAYVLRNGKDMAEAVFNGTADMVSDIPRTCIDAIYAGCLEHNPVTQDEAKALTKAYILEKRKENEKYSFRQLFEEIKTCMEDDGFFDLSGITAMIEEMNMSIEKEVKKAKKTPQDHLKKQTSTK